MRRVFDIVDGMGSYLTCCAMLHNAESQALRNLQEVVVYFGTGRGPSGSVKGMLYLLKDAYVVPIGKQGSVPPRKTEELVVR